MQAIVADTSPLNYLVLIQAADILPSLYRRVLIPPAVNAELAHANTPTAGRAWISQPPQWLEVVGLKQPVDLMYYIGLDVHKQKISYCVKDSSGKICRRMDSRHTF